METRLDITTLLSGDDVKNYNADADDDNDHVDNYHPSNHLSDYPSHFYIFHPFSTTDGRSALRV